MVECGVVRYVYRYRDRRVFSEPSFRRFIPALKDWTALSTRPFDAGWYGGVRTCRIPFLFRNSANSVLVKAVALSYTSTSGDSSEANVFRRSLIVVADVDKFEMCMSTHFEWASVMSKNIFPSTGPA